MSFLDERKSFRRYLKKPIPDSVVFDLLQRASEAPSACNHQLQHFIVINDSQIKAKLQAISGSNDHFLAASHLIVCCFHKGWNHNKHAVVQSVSAMIYHFCLLCYSESIGSVWNAGIGNSDSIRSLLSIPAEFDVLSIVCIGYPDYSYLGSKPPRRDISTFSSLNLFKRPSHSLFPLRRNSDLSYELIKNHRNPYAVHDPDLWTLAQLREWRSYALYAKSPVPGVYTSRRFRKEMPLEVSLLPELPPNSDVLDLFPFGASYTGYLLEKYSDSKVHILELSFHHKNFILERLTNDGFDVSNIQFHALCDFSAFQLPFDAASFDLVFSGQSLEHFPLRKNLVAELFRILSPSGYVYFSSRNLFSWFGIVYFLTLGRGQVPNFGPYRPISPALIFRFLRSGFTLLRLAGISPIPSKIGSISTFFPISLLSRLFVVLLRKS